MEAAEASGNDKGRRNSLREAARLYGGFAVWHSGRARSGKNVRRPLVRLRALRYVRGHVATTSPDVCGEVPEWSNGAVSKTVERASVPRVRIPLSPPLSDFGLRSSRDLTSARAALRLTNPSGSNFLPEAPPFPLHKFLASATPSRGHAAALGRGAVPSRFCLLPLLSTLRRPARACLQFGQLMSITVPSGSRSSNRICP
jgi:hypothetical protein